MNEKNGLRSSSRAAAIASLLLVSAFSPSALAQRNAQAPARRTEASQQQNPVIAAYQRAVQPFLPVDARARLQAIDTTGTERGSYRSLAFIASDRAVRQYAAAALDAAGRPFEASELRQIATFTDEVGADRALDKVGTVLQTVRAAPRPDRNLNAAIASLQAARESLTHAKQITSTAMEMGADRPQGVIDRPAGNDRENNRLANLHATRAVRSSAKAAQQAVRAGADRDHVADLVVQSFVDMVASARNPTTQPTPEGPPNIQQPSGNQGQQQPQQPQQRNEGQPGSQRRY